MQYKLSKSDWEKIGEKTGWLREAQSSEREFDDFVVGPQSDESIPAEHEESDEDMESGEFSYLTDGHEDDAKMQALKQTAEGLAEQFEDTSTVHAMLYWILANHHKGQNSPEYAALSSSPYSPGPMEKGPRGEDEKMIYDELKSAIA